MALSPEIKDAANHIQSHAQGLEAIITLAAFVVDISTLEQLATEAENRKATAQAELDAAKAETDKAKDAAAKAKEKIKEAEDRAAEIVGNAHAEAGNIIGKANGDAKATAAKAEAAAAQRKVEADGEVQAAKAALALVNADIATARETLAELEAQTAEVTKRADDARAYLAKLAGG